MAAAVLVLSCTKEPPPIKYPVVLGNPVIQIDAKKSHLYIDGKKKEFPSNQKEVFLIYCNNEDITWKEFSDIKSITLENDSSATILDVRGGSIEIRYKFSNDTFIITKIKEDGKWVKAPDDIGAAFVGNADSLVLRGTVGKYVGYLYDESGNTIDHNGDGMIDKNDKVTREGLSSKALDLEDFLKVLEDSNNISGRKG